MREARQWFSTDAPVYIEFYKAQTDLQRQKAGQLLPGDQWWVEEHTREEAGRETLTPLEVAVLITFILTTESQVCADAKS